MNQTVPGSTLLFALFGTTVTVVLALAGALWIHWRDNSKAHAELSSIVASVKKAAEIYERSQSAFLETIQAISRQHADMYRDLSARLATLDERSNNHAREIARNAENTHDLRTETRNSLEKQIESVRVEVARVDDKQREDMARIQLRRREDT